MKDGQHLPTLTKPSSAKEQEQASIKKKSDAPLPIIPRLPLPLQGPSAEDMSSNATQQLRLPYHVHSRDATQVELFQLSREEDQEVGPCPPAPRMSGGRPPAGRGQSNLTLLPPSAFESYNIFLRQHAVSRDINGRVVVLPGPRHEVNASSNPPMVGALPPFAPSNIIQQTPPLLGSHSLLPVPDHTFQVEAREDINEDQEVGYFLSDASNRDQFQSPLPLQKEEASRKNIELEEDDVGQEVGRCSPIASGVVVQLPTQVPKKELGWSSSSSFAESEATRRSRSHSQRSRS
jgi:hypothetical protein